MRRAGTIIQQPGGFSPLSKNLNNKSALSNKNSFNLGRRMTVMKKGGKSIKQSEDLNRDILDDSLSGEEVEEEDSCTIQEDSELVMA